jgi:hypothetical protein
MKNRFSVAFLPIAVAAGLVFPLQAAEKEGQWLRVSSKWLLSRMVRPSTAPAHTYRVAIAVPPGAKQGRVSQSSGSSDVDRVAVDYAQEMIRSNGSLRDMANSKELYFQLVITPPALDIKMRSAEGKRPAPPGKELYAPTSPSVFFAANQNETTSRDGELVVIFPPGGGYASEAIVTVSSGNPAVDRYFLHTSALNWQATRKSAQTQVHRGPFNMSAPSRGQSILDR